MAVSRAPRAGLTDASRAMQACPSQFHRQTVELAFRLVAKPAALLFSPVARRQFHWRSAFHKKRAAVTAARFLALSAKAFLPKRPSNFFLRRNPSRRPAGSILRPAGPIATHSVELPVSPFVAAGSLGTAQAADELRLPCRTRTPPGRNARGARARAFALDIAWLRNRRNQLLLRPHSRAQAFETRTRRTYAPPCQGGPLSVSRVSHVHHHPGHVGARRRYLRPACCMSGAPAPAYFRLPKEQTFQATKTEACLTDQQAGCPRRRNLSKAPISASSPGRLTGKHLGRFRIGKPPLRLSTVELFAARGFAARRRESSAPGSNCRQLETPRSS